jgi:hypothetical protein
MGGIWKPVYLVASDKEINSQALSDYVQQEQEKDHH